MYYSCYGLYTKSSMMCNILCQNDPKPSKSLLAIAVGIKQKEIVDKIVRKVGSLL